MTATPFAEFAILLLLAAAAGALFVRLRQPVLIAYIVVGIALGPAGLGWVKAHDQVALLAQIGVTVLLFIVGLKLGPAPCAPHRAGGARYGTGAVGLHHRGGASC